MDKKHYLRTSTRKQLTNKFQLVCHSKAVAAAKYVKLTNNNKVKIQVIYRYGKESNYLEDKNQFLKEHKKFFEGGVKI